MKIEDLNETRINKIKYPTSFDYTQHFDGFDSKHSMPGVNLPKLQVNGGRERFLKQEKPFNEIRELYREDETNKMLI